MEEQRLIDLESKYSHQQILIEELQQTTHEQYLIIDKLEKLVKQLTDKLEGAAGNTARPTHEKPPHY